MSTVVDDAVLTALRRLDGQLQRFRVVFAARHQLSVGDANTINTLANAGGAMTPSSLAKAVGVTAATMTTMLDRLERGGYVTRRPNAGDRRSVHVVLEEPSRSAIGEVRTLIATAVDDAVGPLGRGALAGTLDRLNLALEQAAADYARG